jgi:hypothetical protein
MKGRHVETIDAPGRAVEIEPGLVNVDLIEEGAVAKHGGDRISPSTLTGRRQRGTAYFDEFLTNRLIS